MKVNEVREFSIDYNAKKSCNLVDKHGKKVDTYYIKKKQPFFPFMEMLFEASMDKEFPESAIGLLGHAKCDEAFIFNVYVSDGEGGLYARQCGIGTSLSALCMIDEDVNRGDGVAMNLNRYFRQGPDVRQAVVDATITEVKKECKGGLVGLYMAALEGEGNVYFEAARKVGYKRMIVFDQREQHQFSSLTVEEAQKCYNEDKLDTKDWFFCEGSKFPNLCSTKPCPCAIL